MNRATVFISYRREDSGGYAGRLYDRLVSRLGRDRVYRDVESIEPGADFAESILNQLAACDALVVVIGPSWVAAADPQGGRRLEDPRDLVRAEVVLGLERKLRVIPVLVQGAKMPGANDLPGPLAGLARLNAIEIHESGFEHDCAQLIKAIGAQRRRYRLAITRARYFYPVAACVIVAAAVGLAFWFSPASFLTAEQARLRIGALGMDYTSGEFVHRANDGDIAAVKLFLRAGISIDDTPFEETAIVSATEEGHLAVVKALAEAGANVDRAMTAAGQGKSKAVLDYLLNRRPKTKSIAGALSGAAGQGANIEYVRDLLDHGVNLNSEWGGTPLMDAAYYGNEEIVKLLIERGADVNRISEGGETALHYAARAQKHSTAVIEILLGAGAKVNVQDKEGRTPLMDGLENRETMLVLLTQQPDVTLREKNGATVIYYAACRNLEWLIKPLIDRGANVNAANNAGATPLMCATGEADSVDKPQMAQALIDNGADVNLATLEGETALMFAVKKGLAGCVRVLLHERARVGAKNKHGQTAVDIAKEGKQPALLKLLSGG